MIDQIREALVIANPRAGRARSTLSARLDRARKILSDARIETEVKFTDGPGAAEGIAREAAGAARQMVIACGGDGTLNEVVNGLAGSHVPLALLPAGTANVLAKELGLPWNIERAAALIQASQLRRIALGSVTTHSQGGGKRYFLSVGGAGPDGAIVPAVSHGLKNHTGTLAYWAEGFRQLVRYKFPRFRVIVDGKSIEATLVVVGRTKHYGGPFKITTEADLYGTDFELMICTMRTRWLYLSYLPLLWTGRLRGARHTKFLHCSTVRCEPIGGVPAYLQVDGEGAGLLPAEFKIAPDALTLVVPPAGGRPLA